MKRRDKGGTTEHQRIVILSVVFIFCHMSERFRVRWWHLAIIFVVLALATFVTGALAIRAQGRMAYDEAITRVKTAGMPASVDEYVALAPAVDHKLQDDWASWQRTYAALPNHETLSHILTGQEKDWNAWVAGAGDKPATIDNLLAKAAPNFAPALPVLRKGGLVLSAWGWIATELPSGKRRMPHTTAITLPNILAVRDLSEWLHLAAVCADDPREHLAALDALHHATDRAGSLIDAMVAAGISRVRDRTYGDLMLMGRLPAKSMQRWLAENCRATQLLAEAFDGERVLMVIGTAASLDDEPAIAGLLPGGAFWRNLRTGSDLWLHGYRDCAIGVDLETHVAQRLRRERHDAWPDWSTIQSRVGYLGAMLMPNLSEFALICLADDAGHRMSRVVVQVTGLSRQHGRLPTDQRELITWLGGSDLLKPPGDHLHLLYEVPEPRRFRLTIDPASPIPNFDDAVRAPIRSKSAGTPPAAVPLVWQIGPQRSNSHGQYIEILLPPSSGSP